MVDRACLRDINITSVGKQLTILRCIQELLSKGDLQFICNNSLQNIYLFKHYSNYPLYFPKMFVISLFNCTSV